MRITVNNSPKNHSFYIAFPTLMIFNRFTVHAFIRKQSKNNGSKLSRKQKRAVYKFVSEVNKYKRRKDKLPVVEVESGDTTVKITL